jgi:hypothetical protein
MFRLFMISSLVLGSHLALTHTASAQITRAWDLIPPEYRSLKPIDPPRVGTSFSVPAAFEVEADAIVAIAGAGADAAAGMGFVEIVAYEYDVRSMSLGREVARDRTEWSTSQTPQPAVIVLHPKRRTQYKIRASSSQGGYSVRGFVPK